MYMTFLKYKNVMFTTTSIKTLQNRLEKWRNFSLIDTIISPRITEKATSLSEQNKIVFKVHDGASKKSIKKV